MNSEGSDEHPVRTLVIMVAVGIALFVLGLFVLLGILDSYDAMKPDPSVVNFYPIMAGCGALVGFERWWAHEQGGVNPFHDN